MNNVEKNLIKNNIAKKALLLGWNVVFFDKDTLVIKKNKVNMCNFEKNTDLLLNLLLSSEEFDSHAEKKYVMKAK